MSDNISRADAIEAVRYLIYDRQEKGAKPFKWWFIKQRLMALPSADAVQGEWILVKGSNGKDYHKCSKCLHTQEITGVKNYCAVCGTRMKGGDDE